MSITSNTGIKVPNDNTEQADKSTLVSIITELASKLSDLRQDTDRISKEVANTKGEVSDLRNDTDRVSKKVAETNGRVSDLEEPMNTDTTDATESDAHESPPR